MFLLPVAAREVREASRQPRTYAWRAATASAALTVLALFAWISRYSNTQGHELFIAVSTVAYIYCLIAGAVRTADTIAEEKRENTLGLLFLTDLKGWDIILGKLLSSSVNCLFGLLALIPMLAIPMLMGGVQWTEFLRVILSLLVTLLLSISWGFLISSLFRLSVVTISCALGVMIFLAAGLPLAAMVLDERFHARALSAAVFVFSPTHCHVFAFDTRAPSYIQHYWKAIAINFLIALLNLRLAIFCLPRFWQEVPKNRKTQQWRDRVRALRFGEPKAKKRLRTRLLNQNPFFWLANREQVSSAGLMAVATFILLAGFAIGLASSSGAWRGTEEIMVGWMVALALVHGVIAFRMAMAASYRLAEDRRSGALELLLGTEISIRELLRGYWMGLGRQFFGPAMIAFFSGIFAIMMALLEFSDSIRLHGNIINTAIEIVRRVFTRGADKEAGLIFFVIVSIQLMLALNWIALIWVGMWLGLRERRPGVATWATLSCVMVPPWLVLICGMITVVEVGMVRGIQPDEGITTVLVAGWILGGSNVALLTIWARRNLLTRFREAAADRYLGPRRISWPKVRRVAIRFAAAGACVVLLFYVARLAIDHRGNAAWARARAAHPNFSLEHPTSERIPDDQNLAKGRILSSFSGRGANRNLITWNLSSVTSPSFNNETLNWEWSQHRRMNLAYVENSFVERKILKERRNTPAETVLEGLSQYNDQLDELRQEAAARPMLQFVARAASSAGQGPFPNQFAYNSLIVSEVRGPIRQLVETLAVLTSANLALGQTNTSDLFLALRLADGVKDHPQSLLSYNEMMLDCAQPIYDGLTRRTWNNHELKRIQEYFARQDFWTEFDRYREEYLRDTIREGDAIINARRGQGRSRANWLARLAPIGFVRKWQADMLGWGSDSLLKIVDTKMRHVDLAALREMSRNRPAPPHARRRPDQIVIAIHSAAYLQTTSDQIVVACAVERFRNDRGALPEKLEQLMPDYLNAIPGDVFTNAPLHYIVSPDKKNYAIHSIGPDGVDNNGIAALVIGSWMFWQEQPGTDWVWNSNATDPPPMGASKTKALKTNNKARVKK